MHVTESLLWKMPGKCMLRNWPTLKLLAVLKDLHKELPAQCVWLYLMLALILFRDRWLKTCVQREQRNRRIDRPPVPIRCTTLNRLLSPMLPLNRKHLSIGRIKAFCIESNEFDVKYSSSFSKFTSVSTTHMNIQKQMFGFKIKIVVQNITQANANMIFLDTSVSMTWKLKKKKLVEPFIYAMHMKIYLVSNPISINATPNSSKSI